jgi:tetratricopeptide (TPR) repeat protein
VACLEEIRAGARICPFCRSKQFPNRWKTFADILKWVGGIAAVISLVIGITNLNKVLSNWREKKEAVSELVEATRIRKGSNDYEGAWHLIEEALKLDPASEEARDVQVRLAMEWVRSKRMYYLDRKKSIGKIEKLLPSLYRGAASSNSVFKSDVLAHIGWAEWIRQKGEMFHLDVKRQFSTALEIDPQNMYANTMMGHWLLAKRSDFRDNWENIDTAMKHFAVAIDGNRDRDYVRYWQIRGLLSLPDRKGIKPVLELVNAMRENNENLNWAACEMIIVIFRRLYTWRDDETSEKELAKLVSFLNPEDLLATYIWLTREVNFEEKINIPYRINVFTHKFIIARLTEATGNYEEALKQYRSVIAQLDQMELRKSDGEWYTREKCKRAVARVEMKK